MTAQQRPALSQHCNCLLHTNKHTFMQAPPHDASSLQLPCSWRQEGAMLRGLQADYIDWDALIL